MVGRMRPGWLPMLLLAWGAVAPALRGQVPESLYDGMRWRLVGPFRGGRSEAVAGIPGNPNVYYFGAVAGGVWKTTDGGIRWRPIFDNEPVQSIGAIAVDPSNPQILYVGTGESALRDDIDFGDGVYKSPDGGRTWTNIGLGDTRHIAKILVDPRRPDTVFVAALGHAFGPNAERGVFRSDNGGRSWRKVLYVDENTGAGDLAFDPNNSSVLYAAMYQARRMPWSMISGGPGSGLYKSTDGGATWTHLEGHGLPSGILGRIGVAVSKADSNRVYAMIEAEKNALYRSNDGGQNWQMTNDDSLWVRPWYGNDVFADPQNADRVYLLDLGLYRSDDGGRTFRPLPVPHSDEHDLWIDPGNPQRMIEANDGGATISTDGGASWTAENNQPTAQFYHVATDGAFNYRLYGSQQDSGTVAIRRRSDEGSIGEKDWKSVGGGESGFILPDPRDPEIVYAGDHNGHFTRYDGHTGQVQIISPWLGARAHVPGELEHRFNWTSPMALSPHDPNVLYIGAEALFKSANGGMSWTVISPDLTRNDKSKQESSPAPLTPDNSSAEYYDTLFAVAESPVQAGAIWAGSDDGLVHLTVDGGRHWTDVTPKQLPEWTRVNTIEPSRYDAGTAYLAGDRHMLDDPRPLIYKTTDFGRSWTEIVNGLPPKVSVEAVREDPVRRGLLFAGMETGIYVSFDDGAHWQSLQLNLPRVPVYDMAVHGDDLAIATHGRAFWMLDDITPLRQASAAIASEPAHLYTPAPAYRERGGGGFGGGGGGREDAGVNPPAGAILDYYLASAPADPITVQIVDSQGEVVRRFTSARGRATARFPAPGRTGLPARAGMNRFVWNLREEGPRTVPGLVILELERDEGPFVMPGTYQAKLTVAGRDSTAALEVKIDPRVHASAADLQKQFDFAVQVRDRINQVHDAVNQIAAARKALEAVRQHANASNGQAIDAAERKMAAIEEQLTQVHSTTLGASLVYPIMLDAQYADLANTAESADTAPTAQTYDVFEGYERKREALLAQWKALEGEIAELEKR
ncbi:MAG TPA: hypothetical protein VGS20_11600 [Candidatus Acidoferrales bacterium]|nr:hypothetical protein [Candidatus Acidoferrales bacterium]